MDFRAVDGRAPHRRLRRRVDLPAEQASSSSGRGGPAASSNRRPRTPARSAVRRAASSGRSPRDGRGRWREPPGPGTARRRGHCPSSVRWPVCRPARPRVRPTRAVRRDATPSCSCSSASVRLRSSLSGSRPISVIAREKCSTARSFAESLIARRPARWSACVARCARLGDILTRRTGVVERDEVVVGHQLGVFFWTAQRIDPLGRAAMALGPVRVGDLARRRRRGAARGRTRTRCRLRLMSDAPAERTPCARAPTGAPQRRVRETPPTASSAPSQKTLPTTAASCSTRFSASANRRGVPR